MQNADGVIVGTSLKTGKVQKGNVNIKKYGERVDIEKVKEFTSAFRKATRVFYEKTSVKKGSGRKEHKNLCLC